MTENSLKTSRYESIVYIFFLFSLIFLICIPLFHVEMTDNSDILPHMRFIQKGISTGSWFSYTIYDFLVYALSLGSSKIEDWIFVTIFLLSFLVAIKSVITFCILKDDGLNNKKSFIIACALMFVTPIMIGLNWQNIYLGQVSPTIWHNATTILSIPFAILLFFFSVKALKSFKISDFIPVWVLLVLCGITKPHYLLAFIPVFFVIICYHLLVKKQLIKLKREQITLLIITFIPVMVLLFYEYVSLFNTGYTSKIIFAPFVVWSMYSKCIPLSLLVSVAFPISFTLVYFNQMRDNSKIIFSWLVFIVALLQMALFAISGRGMGAGNLFWGSYIALFILFLTCVSSLMKQPVNKKWLFVMTIFLLHVISGLAYYFKILMGYGYV